MQNVNFLLRLVELASDLRANVLNMRSLIKALHARLVVREFAAKQVAGHTAFHPDRGAVAHGAHVVKVQIRRHSQKVVVYAWLVLPWRFDELLLIESLDVFKLGVGLRCKFFSVWRAMDWI